ncbi:MAG: xylulokinase [Ruminococcaceae bacterium]|nr:xylulokinase [Oscillospiraceae bacterium]
MMKYVIGIDLGTSATKTVLFDETGKITASESYDYPMYQPHNGWAEQNPEDWYNAAITTLNSVVSKSGVNKKDIVSLGISGQMHGLVMLDEGCNVLRPSILWCDQRTAKECEQLTEMLGRDTLIKITANPALTGFTASKILWVKNNEPEIFDKCRHILLPKDYLRFRLTGEFATEVSDASGMQLLDVPNRKWSDVMINTLGIKEEYLAKVYESPEITGYINEDTAEKTGLSTKTTVVGGAGDNAAAAVGMGVVTEGKAFTTIGTSGVVFAHTDNPIIDPEGRVHTFCCAVPNAWHVMGVTQGAGLSLQWFKNNFCYEEKQQAKDENKDVYQITDEKAKNIPIGCDKLIYLPYLMGERTPHLDPDCRGVFFGLSAMHTKSHLIRAVMEGVTYSLYDCLLVLKEMNIAPLSMLLCGGGSKSKLWKSMICNTFAMPVETSKSSEAPALGVAILAAVGAGIYPDVKTACLNMVPSDSNITEPVETDTKLYRSYHKIYASLYASLKENYKALANMQ